MDDQIRSARQSEIGDEMTKTKPTLKRVYPLNTGFPQWGNAFRKNVDSTKWRTLENQYYRLPVVPQLWTDGDSFFEKETATFTTSIKGIKAAAEWLLKNPDAKKTDTCYGHVCFVVTVPAKQETLDRMAKANAARAAWSAKKNALVRETDQRVREEKKAEREREAATSAGSEDATITKALQILKKRGAKITIEGGK